MSPRARSVADDADPPADLIVVGGGINGAAIARDAAGRGLATVLVEQDDLASHTSSASSKLIHGGLRYLEHGEFALVRKALAEREVLLRAAPHLVRLQEFVLPLVSGMRPAWMLRAGLFLYDRLAQRERVPGSTAIDLRCHAGGAPLRAGLERGFVYHDAWTDDARLVVANALDCVERGGSVLTHTRCESAEREQGHWLVKLADSAGRRYSLRARALVNATGPWATRFLALQLRRRGGHAMRLVRGSHIVVPALYSQRHAYILQQPDRRVVFAIPYQGGYTLIGTTEVEHRGDPALAEASHDEIAYLCAAANRSFAREISPLDVVWQFAGVRPLFDDQEAAASSASRDYALELDDDGAPLLNVFGGKLTTHRALAEEALNRLAPLLGCGAGPWTTRASLPGGDMPDSDFEAYSHQMARSFDWLPAPLLMRWLGAYGTRVEQLIDDAASIDGLGEELLPGLFAIELQHLARREWARSGEDVLWRRTKLGLTLPLAQRTPGAERIDRALAELRV